jgi:phosphoadenosine phosphosulfate reductase
MSLIEQTLWGERDKVQMAIERLRAHEPAEGYYLAFSGGKDSVVIYRLAQMAGVQFDAHYQITTVDPPELVQFIKAAYPEVERVRPQQSMWQLVASNDWPPTRQQRYCCKELKETGGHGRVVVTGVRWAESARRAKRHMTETCYSDGTRTFLHPIIDWTNDDVWEFIRRENVPYCSLYDEGFTRLGCVLCPNDRNPERQIARWPKIAAQYVRTFDKVIAHRNEVGKRCTFNTGQELFDWWIARDRSGQNEAQPVLFE